MLRYAARRVAQQRRDGQLGKPKVAGNAGEGTAQHMRGDVLQANDVFQQLAGQSPAGIAQLVAEYRDAFSLKI